MRVRYELLRFGLTSKEAFEVEAAAIQLLGLKELLNAIATRATHWNKDPKPFIWKAHRSRHHRQSPTRARRPQPDQINDGSLVVESGGILQGRFLMIPTADTRPTLEQWLVAIAFADQVGAALAATHSVDL